MPLGKPLFQSNQSKSLTIPDRDSPSGLDKTLSQAIAKDKAAFIPQSKLQLFRRHSDPGSNLEKVVELHSTIDTIDGFSMDFQSHKNSFIVDTASMQNELEKDETLSHLLLEIRNLRQINRKLSVELFHSKMLLQIAEQNNHYSSEPGSASALVRKLIDAHHAKYDFRSRMPTSSEEETSLNFTSPSPKLSTEAEHPSFLEKEYEELKHKLHTIESKLKERQYAQGGLCQQHQFRSNNGHMTATVDRLTPTFVSPSSSTLTSFEDINPPISLNGLNSGISRRTAEWPGTASFHSTRLNGTNGMENLSSSYLGPVNFANSQFFTFCTGAGSLQESKSIDPTSCDIRCNTKHLRSNLSSLI